jgi:hypothetical protein
MIRSFDVFDTLIARRETDIKVILEPLDEGMDSLFIQHRLDADTGNRSLIDIYHAMEEAGHIQKGMAAEFERDEVAMEERNCYPIKENMDQVRDGDILVSDMYMAPADILKLVRAAGMDKQVTIYQSNSGKASGDFYKMIKAAGLQLEYHLGDNMRSDITQAHAHGYDGVHYAKSQQVTQVEKVLGVNKLPSIARILREIRLSNHEPKQDQFFQIAAQLNLPWLFLCCEMLQRFEPEDFTKYVFLGRDCQLMQRLYEAYYNPCYYLPFSRKVALKQPEDATEYLATQTPKDGILVDISSTGRTWEFLDYQGPIVVFFYSDQFHYSETKPIAPRQFQFMTKNSQVGPTNTLIEVFNCADHGRLDTIKMYGSLPVVTFAAPELSSDVVAAIQKPVSDAVALVHYYRHEIKNELRELTDENLIELFSSLKAAICAQPLFIPEYHAIDNAYTLECK